MKLIWTKSKLPLSVAIRWILGQDCSHLALVFESKGGGLMFESNLLGTHPKFFRSAQKHFTIVHEIEVKLNPDQENRAWDLMVDRFDGKGYDFLGAIYLAWTHLKYRLFKTPMPRENKWAKSDVFFCNELYAILEEVGYLNLSIKNAMLSPHDTYVELQRRLSEKAV